MSVRGGERRAVSHQLDRNDAEMQSQKLDEASWGVLD
jgi:hypothetical protein